MYEKSDLEQDIVLFEARAKKRVMEQEVRRFDWLYPVLILIIVAASLNFIGAIVALISSNQ